MAVLPSPDAGPSKVRAYLLDLLIQEHEAPPELAQTSADKWVLGRGSHLRQGSQMQFRELFGDLVGPYLHQDVKRDVEAERWSSSAWKRSYWTTVTASVVTVFFLIKAYFSRSQAQTMDNLRYAMVVFGPAMLFCSYGSPNDEIGILAGTAGFFLSVGAIMLFFARQEFSTSEYV
ncbi:hypothetical protein N7474_006043 [Penicillium riverlandense]|uniref:uncharacterized protein n=1 Tax=Penicillium riverlandense TaxID=1903569 RepID=UPI002546F61C|nr:uncharacterized protein N7474_006043 [Penicillium riverlandense]KAJ5820452.1 hypothetical protein N7474_006043 [Penicillium riverlandense]